MWSLEKAKRGIVVGGCLASVYLQFATSAATIEFTRSLGGTGFHIGVLGAIPFVVLFLQLVAALVVNRLTQRKRLWFWLTILQRLVLLPTALGPWLWPEISSAVWILLLLALTAVNHSLMHFTSPLWLSWMGDYLPHQELNRFWGRRELFMQWTAAAATLVVSLLFRGISGSTSGLEIRSAYLILIAIGAVAGVADILIFIPIEEPPLHRHENPRIREVLLSPFRMREFRTFIFFNCFWHFSTMIGAPFISMFLLEYVGIQLSDVLLLWALAWVGGAICSGRIGQLTERFGQRPVLILSVACKSTLMLTLLVIPPEPRTSFYILIPALMFDAVLNSMITISVNGFLLKNSPRVNRTMFIASGNAFAGIVGGITSVIAGQALFLLKDYQAQWWGLAITGFHMMFFASLLLRFVCIWVATWVHEPSSTSTRQVVRELTSALAKRLRSSQASHPPLPSQPDHTPGDPLKDKPFGN